MNKVYIFSTTLVAIILLVLRLLDIKDTAMSFADVLWITLYGVIILVMCLTLYLMNKRQKEKL